MSSTPTHQPGDRVYFIGWTPSDEELDDGAEVESPEWATVADYPADDPQRTSVVYDHAPGITFPASTDYLLAKDDAPVADPRDTTEENDS